VNRPQSAVSQQIGKLEEDIGKAGEVLRCIQAHPARCGSRRAEGFAGQRLTDMRCE
jgi:hypothetical protein